MNFVYQNGKPVGIIIRAVPRQLIETQEFLLKNNIEDSLMYENQPLLESWSNTMIAERTLKRLDYSRFTWQERGALCRQNNVIKDILKGLATA